MAAVKFLTSGDRASTGVDGLDELIQGGYPRNSAVIVAGRPGAGKTLLSAQFINEGIEKGEKGAVILVAQDKSRYFADVAAAGINFAKAEKDNKLQTFELPILDPKFDEKCVDVMAALKQAKPSRVIVDSFSVLLSACKDDATKRQQLAMLIKHLTEFSTALLTMEKLGLHFHAPEEYASDSVIELEVKEGEHRTERKLKVMKMRRTTHSLNYHALKISKEGLKVFPRMYFQLPPFSSNARVKTGVAGLDAMSCGGFYKGSVTILSGSSGTGKTLLSAQFIIQGARDKQPGLFICCEESPEQLKSNVEALGANFARAPAELISFYRAEIGETIPEDHLQNIKRLIEQKKVQRLVVDSISRLEREEGYRHFIEALASYAKGRGIATILVNETSSMSEFSATEKNISSFADNIIILRYAEVQSTMKRFITLFKARGCKSSNEIREFTIGEDGIKII